MFVFATNVHTHIHIGDADCSFACHANGCHFSSHATLPLFLSPFSSLLSACREMDDGWRHDDDAMSFFCPPILFSPLRHTRQRAARAAIAAEKRASPRCWWVPKRCALLICLKFSRLPPFFRHAMFLPFVLLLCCCCWGCLGWYLSPDAAPDDYYDAAAMPHYWDWYLMRRRLTRAPRHAPLRARAAIRRHHTKTPVFMPAAAACCFLPRAARCALRVTPRPPPALRVFTPPYYWCRACRADAAAADARHYARCAITPFSSLMFAWYAVARRCRHVDELFLFHFFMLDFSSFSIRRRKILLLMHY